MGSASRSGPRRGVALAGVAAAAAALAALVSLTVATPAAAALSCERVPELLRAYLQKHISFHYLNDELRGRAIDTYLKRLDPSKSLMLVHERAALAQSLKGVFHDVRRGECGALTAIRDNMIERYEQTEKFVKAFVGADEYELDSSVELIIDPDKRSRPRTTKEQHALFRRLVHFQMSNYLTNDEELPEAKRKLIHRYELMTKRAKELDNSDVYASFLDSFASALDPHSNYFTADAVEDFQIGMELSLEGIGVGLSSRDGYSIVEKIIPGGAAAKIDELEPNDKIIAVAQADGEFVDIIDMNLRDVVRLIRGKSGTLVRLSVLRQGDTAERLIVSIVRAKIKLEDQAAALRFEIVPGEDGKDLKLAVLELPSFYGGRDPSERQSSRDMRELLQQVKAEKADGLLLDLSRNGGGLLENSVEIAGFFIRNGGVVAVKDTYSKVQILRDPDGSLLYDGPLVLLTSRVSASASEIVAGAMKDYRRAIVVGDDHTFGKGTVQSMVPLGKDLGALKVTTALFFRPGGSSTQHAGVAADIVFPSLYTANELGEEHQDYSLPSQEIAAFLESGSTPNPLSSDPVFWKPVTSEMVEQLATLSALRIEQSEEFADIRRQITETEERNGVLHLSDIYKPKDKDAAKDGDDAETADSSAADGKKSDEQRVHTVEDGDTLATLAKSYLGDADAWLEIAKINQGLEQGQLEPGTRVVIPGLPSTGLVATNAGGTASDLARIPPGTPKAEEKEDQPSPQQREALQILADYVRLAS